MPARAARVEHVLFVVTAHVTSQPACAVLRHTVRTIQRHHPSASILVVDNASPFDNARHALAGPSSAGVLVRGRTTTTGWAWLGMPRGAARVVAHRASEELQLDRLRCSAPSLTPGQPRGRNVLNDQRRKSRISTHPARWGAAVEPPPDTQRVIGYPGTCGDRHARRVTM